MRLLLRCSSLVLLVFSVSGVLAGPPLELAAGHQLAVAAEVGSRGDVSRPAILRITAERLPDAAIVPLSLEVKVSDPQDASRMRHLVTYSFFGVPPGQTITFSEPLSASVASVMDRVKDGKLPVELLLSSSAKPELASSAKIRIISAVVEPEDAPDKSIIRRDPVTR